MGQDYPFATTQHQHQSYEFYTEDCPEDMLYYEWEEAIEAVCSGPFSMQPELGRILIASDVDAKKLAANGSVDVDGVQKKVAMVPMDRSLTYIGHQIRKEFREYDVQVNYRVHEGDDDIFYLTGRIFIRSFEGTGDMEDIRDQIMELYGDKGVSVKYLHKDLLLDLYVAGH